MLIFPHEDDSVITLYMPQIKLHNEVAIWVQTSEFHDTQNKGAA